MEGSFSILGAIMELLPSNIMGEEIIVDLEWTLWSVLHKSLPDILVFIGAGFTGHKLCTSELRNMDYAQHIFTNFLSATTY